jgi:hypothetical protein
MKMKIIGADKKMAEHRGAKVLLLGPPGVGKTSQLRTLDRGRTLFNDIEAGDLSVLDLPVDTVRISTWQQACDLAVRISGPNPSFPPTLPYSQAHYEAVGGALPDLDRYQTIFIDSLTALSRLSFRYAEQQPEAYSERSGKKDLRGAYGLHGRQMILLLNQFQYAREKNVIFVGGLERIVDEFGRGEWQLQAEGSKTSREIPGIVDQIISYQFLDFGDGKLERGFVCTSPNPWGYPAKDRSGRLEMIEPPDLGKLLTKLTTRTIAKENGND